MTKTKTDIQEEKRAFSLNNDAYTKVSCSAQLREIKLIASTYTVRPEAFDLVQDMSGFKNNFSGKCIDYLLSEDDGLAWGRLQWIAEIKSGRRTCLKLSAEYLVLYSDIHDCDEGHVEFYFRKVSRFATYPYFRALFSHHVGETGLVLPPLPTLMERVD